MKKRLSPERPDEENPEWTADDFAQAQPASAVLSGLFGDDIARKMLSGPNAQTAGTQTRGIELQLSPEVLAHFQASGQGWQTRIDAALKQFIAEHPGSR